MVVKDIFFMWNLFHRWFDFGENGCYNRSVWNALCRWWGKLI